jgi:hypothetical protein
MRDTHGMRERTFYESLFGQGEETLRGTDVDFMGHTFMGAYMRAGENYYPHYAQREKC